MITRLYNGYGYEINSLIKSNNTDNLTENTWITNIFWVYFSSSNKLTIQPISWSLVSEPFEPMFCRKWFSALDKSMGLHSSSVPFVLLFWNNPGVLILAFSFEIPLLWELLSEIPEHLDFVGEINTLISVASGIIRFVICPLIELLRKRLEGLYRKLSRKQRNKLYW